ncbi:NAD(P)-binding Rossmann-fold superfamily protein [Actinidia rufa]|uniref:NAD(P)-binding Rossmann-fold superfamily protein n=1 Tax=Actinidia rufa TaxID=165716 RepID=A0A7J0DYM2_9ERIC|nr:NAD(P)-binding Rossmann-fold superfamily protein [Actinidia rufa]
MGHWDANAIPSSLSKKTVSKAWEVVSVSNPQRPQMESTDRSIAEHFCVLRQLWPANQRNSLGLHDSSKPKRSWRNVMRVVKIDSVTDSGRTMKIFVKVPCSPLTQQSQTFELFVPSQSLSRTLTSPNVCSTLQANCETKGGHKFGVNLVDKELEILLIWSPFDDRATEIFAAGVHVWSMETVSQAVLFIQGDVIQKYHLGLENEEKVGFLWDLSGAKERLRIFKADLMVEGSFNQAVKRVDGVFHTASPVLVPYDQNIKAKFSQNLQLTANLVDPCITGTLNVLSSCTRASSVRRVVLTSSCSSIRYRHNAQLVCPLNESHWSDLEYCKRYNVNSLETVSKF